MTNFVTFALLFVAMWFAVLKIVSMAAGWQILANKYMASGRGEGKKFLLAHASIGGPRFPANCGGLSVAVGARGVNITPWPPFRPFCPPLFIPWRAVKSAKAEKFWLIPCGTLEIEDYNGLIRLYGGAGREAVSAFEKFRAPA
jgi:hypothetical protein